MNGIHVHVVSDDEQTNGVLFQVRIGREAQAVIETRNALDHLAEKRGITNRRPDPLGIFVADETIDDLDPDHGLELLWTQIIEEQLNSKKFSRLAEGDSCD